MVWTSEAAGLLARYDCPWCGGSGLEPSAAPSVVPCACVCRRVFQACYRRFRRCAEADASARRVSFAESRRGVDRHLIWFRRNEDYCADFQAAGRRSLSPEQYRLFRYYHLLGGSAELVARRLGVSRAGFFRQLEDVQEAAGREMALMLPHSLYPPRQYMSRVVVARLA